MTHVLQREIKDKDTSQYQLLDVIIRNAIRLQKHTEDILDVTKMENQSLQLNKEGFNLSEMILDAIEDPRNQFKKGDNIILELVSSKEEDRALYQVAMNLLHNAIKFTQQGTIIVEKKEKDNHKSVIPCLDI